MPRKMPNWTRLLTDLVKLGVSANHVIALRMAKLARGDAAARAESKLMVDEKVRAAVDANMEAARSIMTGHSPSRADPRAEHLPKTRAQEFEPSVEARGERLPAIARDHRVMPEQVPIARKSVNFRGARSNANTPPSPLSLRRDETRQDMHITIVVPKFRIQPPARQIRIARRSNGHGSHHYIRPSFTDQSIDVVFWRRRFG